MKKLSAKALWCALLLCGLPEGYRPGTNAAFAQAPVSARWEQKKWEQKMTGPTSLAFSPDGRQLAAGSIEDWASPGDLRIWDTRSGKLLRKERYVYGVEAVAFSPDGKTLAVATDVSQSKDGIRLWNRRTWHTDRTLGGSNYLNSLAYSPDGKWLLTGSNMAETGDTEDAYLWNVATRRSRVLPHSNGLSDVLFAPRGSLIVGAYYTPDEVENLRAWTQAGRFLWRRPQPGLRAIAFLPTGRTLLAAIGVAVTRKKSSGALQIWDAVKGRKLENIALAQSVTAVAVAPGGKRWATGYGDGTVSLWDAARRRIVKTLPLHRAAVTSLTFSPDGRSLASAAADNRVVLTPLP